MGRRSQDPVEFLNLFKKKKHYLVITVAFSYLFFGAPFRSSNHEKCFDGSF